MTDRDEILHDDGSHRRRTTEEAMVHIQDDISKMFDLRKAWPEDEIAHHMAHLASNDWVVAQYVLENEKRLAALEAEHEQFKGAVLSFMIRVLGELPNMKAEFESHVFDATENIGAADQKIALLNDLIKRKA